MSRDSLLDEYLDVKILAAGLAVRLPGVTTTPSDEVDRLVDAWQHERPDLDSSPMQVLSRVTRLARHLDLARREAFEAHGLETWEFDVLTALRRAGAPYQLSPGRLLRETMVTSGTMTNRVDRMATKALVVRMPDHDDKRGVLVRLTPDGLSRVDAALEGLLDQERQLLDGLTTSQRESLAAMLRIVVAPFDDEAP